jgi:hypothetical protein
LKDDNTFWEPEKTKAAGIWIHVGLLYDKVYSSQTTQVFLCPLQIQNILITTYGFGEKPGDQWGMAGYWYFPGANDYRRDNLKLNGDLTIATDYDIFYSASNYWFPPNHHSHGNNALKLGGWVKFIPEKVTKGFNNGWTRIDAY